MVRDLQIFLLPTSRNSLAFDHWFIAEHKLRIKSTIKVDGQRRKPNNCVREISRRQSDSKPFFSCCFVVTRSQERWLLHPCEQTNKQTKKKKKKKEKDRRINRGRRRKGKKKVPSWKSSNLLQLIMRQASNSGSNESISHQRSHTKWLPLDIIFYHFARLIYRLLKLSFPSLPSSSLPINLQRKRPRCGRPRCTRLHPSSSSSSSTRSFARTMRVDK